MSERRFTIARSRSERLRLILILGALTAFGPLSIDMYLPAFPALEAEFRAGAGAVQATLAVYFAGLAVGQSLYGPLSDRIGRRPPLLFGISLYVAASIAAALAPTVAALTVARVAQALGGCAGVVIARAMVRDLYDERESARTYSRLILVMGLAPILAPLVGGQLLAIGWPAIFWTLAGFGVACLLAVIFGLGETLPRDRRARGGLVEALRAYLSLLSDRRFVGFALTGGLAMSGMFAYIVGSPFVFIQLYGVSPQHFGFLFGANAAGLILASQINVRLLKRFSSQTILASAIVVNMAAALSVLAVAVTGVGGVVGLMIPLFLTIANLGFTGANAMAAAMARAGGSAGAGAALIGVTQFGIGALAGTVIGMLEDGTALPMAAAIAAFAVAAFLVHRLVARPPAGP